MEELIVIEVVPEDVSDKHRGWTGVISVGSLEQRSEYKVTCKSKYKLKNGLTRIKFTGTLIEKNIFQLSKITTVPGYRIDVIAFLSDYALNIKFASVLGSAVPNYKISKSS